MGWGRRSGPFHPYAWYRLTVQVGPPDAGPTQAQRARLRLGLWLGKIDSAYEVYAGGIRLGGAGGLPPQPRIEYDRHRTYPVPPEAVAEDGRLVIALRVWKSEDTRADVGRKFETRYYTIWSDVDEALARDLSIRMDAMYEEYMRRFASFAPVQPQEKLSVFIFARRADYSRYTEDRIPNSGGIYIANRKQLAAFLEGQGRDALRRDHRVSAGRRALRRVERTALGPHSAVDPRASVLRARAGRPRRILPRPRAHRADAVRRRTPSAGWTAFS